METIWKGRIAINELQKYPTCFTEHFYTTGNTIDDAIAKIKSYLEKEKIKNFEILELTSCYGTFI